MKKLLFYLLVFVSPCVMPTVVFGAKSVSFTVNKTTLSASDELSVTASASGFTAGDILYIKGAFFKEGSSNYFGLTKNGDSWIKNSVSASSQRQVKIGEWDGNMLVKSDPDDSGFSDSGSYKFKVGFYTVSSSGDPSSVNWSDTVTDIQLERPAPTNTPQPTATHTPTPNPTSIPSSTPKPTAVPSPTGAKTPTPKLSPTPTEEDEEEVLGTDTDLDITPTPTGELTPTPTPGAKSGFASKNAMISLLFVGAGAGLLSAVLFGKKLPFFKKKTE